MTKTNRRGWLDKISRWILDVFPGGESSQQQDAPPAAPPREPEAISAEPTAAAPRPEGQGAKAAPPKAPGRTGPKAEPLAEAPEASAPPTPEPPSEKTLIKAWKAFELAWTRAGLSPHYFLNTEELISTLTVLDQTFEEELIEWLFQLCTKPAALTDLAAIIERGQVRPTDNVDAIRAFAYVSVAVVSRPVLQAPKQPAVSHLGQQPAQTELTAKPQQRPAVESAHKVETPAATQQPEQSSADTDEQESSVAPEKIESDTGTGIPNQAVEELGLSMRTTNSLKRSDLHTLLDLAGKSEQSLLDLKNFGTRSVTEVRDALEKLGLGLPFAASEISGHRPQSGDDTTQESTSRTGPPPDRLGDVKDLGLSARTLNCLYRGKVFSIAELIRCTESDLLSFPNLGQTALDELHKVLADRDLALAVPSPATQRSDNTGATPEQLMGPSEESWDQLRQRALDLHGTTFLSEQQLAALCQDMPENPASHQLQELLIRLQAVKGYLTDHLLINSESSSSELGLSLNALQTVLYGRLLGDSLLNAQDATNRLSRSLKESDFRNWSVYLYRCRGKTLTAIGEDQGLTRERVRQLESKIIKAVGIKPSDLASTIKESQLLRENAAELELIQAWLARLDRLPVAADDRPSDVEPPFLWKDVVCMNLKERINLLIKHKLAPTSKEYDYHYSYVTARTGPVGTGYWREFENLKQFVIRHAAALGSPNVMPNQTSFPDSVRGVVTSYGGQSKVAKKIGLEYRGQLVGEDGGRTYWTDDKLGQLLVDVNTQLGLGEELMPSYGQVLEFFTISPDPKYQDKKPHSAIAALTKMGRLHWSEVAKRFNKRFISGESQKAVTISYIKAFVRDLGEHLDSLTPSELFVLFQAQGINRGEREKFSRTFDALVDAVQSGMVDKEQLRNWAANNDVDTINDLLELGAELKEEGTLEKREQLLLERRSRKLNSEFPEAEATADLSVDDLPTLEPKAVLKALDKAAELVESSSSDGDKVEFLKAKATAKLWDACFRDEQALIAKLKELETASDSYSHEVQQAFLDEYEGAKALAVPASYAFRDLKGIPRQPKLMQRLVAYRLERDLRLLNLSGTGTGKTLSAVFAAQVCGSQRILISCPNGVIDSWRRCLESAYPSATVHIKPDGWELDELADGVNVVIVNHERFQDRFAQQLLGFCIGYQADLVVIDEIHKSKSRSTDASSQRRKLMNEFIRISANVNPDLRVLGLSATPVINNLYEGRSLIELICQESIDDVGENVDLNSCMNLYQHFIVRGIRMNPGKLPRTEISLHEVDATPLLPEIVRATKRGSFHDVEQLLVPPKIKGLHGILSHGSKTVIFITYIKNTLQPLCQWLAANQFSYSVFTGDEKEAQDEGFRDSLDEFIRGKSEVLVATIQCAGTGIDGLQSVCNNAVFFQLPWTSTEFEQAIGRLDRDGTDFDSVSIHVPITDIALPDGQRWSWCRSKLDRIESKRDIAKAAVDGEIPDAASLITPSEASKYWLKWLEKLDQGNHGS
jgi:DNA-directed RNA polymerase alpha subunit